MFTFEEMEEISRRKDETRRAGISISAYGSGPGSWRVRVAIGRTGSSSRPHEKTIRGTKKEAQAYADWVKELAASGHGVTSTVSQSELKELHVFQARADRFRTKLQAAVSAGAKIEPGALKLGVD